MPFILYLFYMKNYLNIKRGKGILMGLYPAVILWMSIFVIQQFHSGSVSKWKMILANDWLSCFANLQKWHISWEIIQETSFYLKKSGRMWRNGWNLSKGFSLSVESFLKGIHLKNGTMYSKHSGEGMRRWTSYSQGFKGNVSNENIFSRFFLLIHWPFFLIQTMKHGCFLCPKAKWIGKKERFQARTYIFAGRTRFFEIFCWGKRDC